jgi:STE24 endopeptidase
VKSLLLLIVFAIWLVGVAPRSATPVAVPQLPDSHLLLKKTPNGWIVIQPQSPAPLGFVPANGQGTFPVERPNSRDMSLFLGGYLVLVLSMALWSRVMARRIHSVTLHRGLRRYNWGMFLARLAVPAWMAVGVFALHWGPAVMQPLGRLLRWPIDTPATLIGVLPALAAWAGLWWSQFPADRALREQSLLVAFDQELALRPPPGMWDYLASHLRIDLLFLLVPILLVLLLHDCMSLALWKLSWIDAQGAAIGPLSDNAIAALDLLPVMIVFIFAPELLTRVLQTQRLPASPLLGKLQSMCRDAGVRYRAILLWLTHNNVGNAAVMGVFPHVRYVLLSDLLVESMTDEQVEAVFAHELGHVVHRHLVWYGALILLLLLATCGPLQSLTDWAHPHLPIWARDTLPTVLILGAFVAVFGFYSRAFERQADVYAARTVEALRMRRRVPAADEPADEPDDMPPELAPAVGPDGSALFASALRRAALINNIPTEARNFSHGSIANRIDHLRWLSQNPTRTIVFEQSVRRLCWILAAAIVICGVWTSVLFLHGG